MQHFGSSSHTLWAPVITNCRQWDAVSAGSRE